MKYLATIAVVCILSACSAESPTAESTGTQTQASVFPTVSFYSWSVGAGPVTMTPTTDSFCFLRSIIGKFTSTNDQAVVSTGFSAYWNATAWEIYGAGGIVQILAECILEGDDGGDTSFPGGGMQTFWMAGNGIPQSEVSQAVAPVAGHFCFTLAISGDFVSDHDFAVVYPLNGNWTQSIEDNDGEIVSEVGCVSTTLGLNPPAGAARYCSENGAGCADGATLPSYFNDVCALSAIQGDWRGIGRSSFGQVVTNTTTGAQSLATSISGNGAGVQSICAGP